MSKIKPKDIKEAKYRVEKIVGQKVLENGEKSYLVKFFGLPNENNKWVNENKLKHMQNKIEKFLETAEEKESEKNEKISEKEIKDLDEINRKLCSQKTQKEEKEKNGSKEISEKKEKRKAEVLGLAKKDGKLLYVVFDGKKEQILSHEVVLKKFCNELLDFYENNIVFTEKLYP